MRYIEGCLREQILLFQKAIDNYTEDNNPLFKFIDALDMKEFEFK